MNAPLLLKTVKPIENLKTSKGTYSDKNKSLVELASKVLKLGLGCNLVIDLEYSDNSYYEALDGVNYEAHDGSKQHDGKAIVNFFMNLSIGMSDRCFLVSHNKENQLMVTCLPKKKFPSTILVRDKNAITEKSVLVKSVYDNNKSNTVKVKTSKGIRPINDSEVSSIITSFNAMLGVGYNKPLIDDTQIQKKEKSVS